MACQGKTVNLGCGKYFISGWINADLYRHADVMFDVRSRWPIPDGQLVSVRLEHVWEQVAYPDDALHVLEECYRVLTPDGTLRMGVPDTQKGLRADVEGEHAHYFGGIASVTFDPTIDRAECEEGTLGLSGTKPSQQEPRL